MLAGTKAKQRDAIIPARLGGNTDTALHICDWRSIDLDAHVSYDPSEREALLRIVLDLAVHKLSCAVCNGPIHELSDIGVLVYARLSVREFLALAVCERCAGHDDLPEQVLRAIEPPRSKPPSAP